MPAADIGVCNEEDPPVGVDDDRTDTDGETPRKTSIEMEEPADTGLDEAANCTGQHRGFAPIKQIRSILIFPFDEAGIST
jgi:hypothetical protein